MHFLQLLFLSVSIGFVAADDGVPLTLAGGCQGSPLVCEQIDPNAPALLVTASDAAANAAGCKGKKFGAGCTFHYHE
ncbi:hypothetical protein LX32DRAFT_636989 [Colletotrichum zoysiae]|uniref:Uncharacterized protein n=1 Tax=Colletotrichum zoysiae TaxID=1216348 RepID=A0AAD9HMS1_9PEZI|nr:hypothetical protein LX32DRAFT_636989 [Colletotrichum zoysiae]